ncbi:hypothetical protein [Xanthomonas phage DES1]|nr:hypothetical protein [Xanthomonas phage DES1]
MSTTPNHPLSEEALGSRFNAGKLRWGLLPYDALAQVVEVLMAGAVKYGDSNWKKGLKFSETFESLQRHAIAWYNGETKDPETGLHHMAHVGCNALFLLWFAIRGKGVDDRPFNVKTEQTPYLVIKSGDSLLGIPSERRRYGSGLKDFSVQMRD